MTNVNDYFCVKCNNCTCRENHFSAKNLWGCIGTCAKSRKRKIVNIKRFSVGIILVSILVLVGINEFLPNQGIQIVGGVILISSFIFSEYLYNLSLRYKKTNRFEELA